ncbi:MAG: hypothetical protein NC517_11960, partial [Firmicutes bacterium]|nr:hypothetical protein [Bacillota bacterium]
REDVNIMCNLSQGIMEKGIAQGITEGIAQGRAESEIEFIFNMYENDFPLEKIAIAAKKSLEEVNAVIEKGKPMLV